ncbi:MAG: response regulator transcription factor [Microbacterium sp.]
MAEIRVVITDDDPLVRSALSLFIAQAPEVTVVAEARDGFEAIAAVEQHQPDIVMMDVQMPGMDGIKATERITRRWPHVRVLAVTTLDTRDTVLRMLNAGATGFMLKDATPDELVDALRNASQGMSTLSPRTTSLLVKHVREGEHRAPITDLEPLTERETEVLQRLAKGMSNAEIAGELHVSEGTVKAHFGSIMAKWQVRDRVQVLVAAARAGLISFD